MFKLSSMTLHTKDDDIYMAVIWLTVYLINFNCEIIILQLYTYKVFFFYFYSKKQSASCRYLVDSSHTLLPICDNLSFFFFLFSCRFVIIIIALLVPLYFSFLMAKKMTF